MNPESPVIVIGAGLAGLNCAHALQKAGVNFLLLEQSDGVGGRVRTDVVDGFRLDRGFQVFQTAYPEAQEVFDYAALDLRPLEPGALIRKQGKWVRMSDPWRRPQHALGTLFNSIGKLSDRFKLLKLRSDCRQGSIDELLSRADDCSTEQLLRERYRFSESFIESFLRPWLSGIFLENQLSTSANYFRFVFRMLSAGDISYPASGIGALPAQLAARLGPEQLRLNSSVVQVEENAVTLWTGERIEARAIVLASELDTAKRLLGDTTQTAFSATRCIYFAADKPPLSECILMLNGDGSGPINHVFVMTNASPQLAPRGQALISVSLVGEQARNSYDAAGVLRQLHAWFGPQVSQWRELANYYIPHALPQQPAGFAQQPARRIPPGIFLAGDHSESTSVQGALKSGRLAAERVLQFISEA